MKRIRDLEVQKGKLLEYLGLTLDYRTDGVVKIDASSYIQKALDGYGVKLKGKAKTPAADDLFTVRSEAEALNEDERKKFHSVSALTLWIGSMARPDILEFHRGRSGGIVRGANAGAVDLLFSEEPGICSQECIAPSR